MSNLTGQSLGRYHILEPLGEGGMAIVYKAYDTRLENEVAVKVIRTERLSPEILQRALKRFEREAKSLAQLTHPNIVHVLDYGEHAGQPYLVMPYVPGGTLKQLLNGKPMQWQRAARLLIPIARALDYAHKRGIVHRDIKPSNIMITESGEPMLTDFGVAKIIDEEATLDLTGTNATVGTPEYMAPEQVNSKTTDYRVDIYALGIVLYEMVTGRRPFEGDTPLATLFKQATDPLPRPSQFVTGIPNSVEMILVKALAKKPADRYQSMGEVANALDSLLSGNIPAPKDFRPKKESASSPPISASKRPVSLWVSLGVIGVALIGILIREVARGAGIEDVIPTYSISFTATPYSTQTFSVTNTPPTASTVLPTTSTLLPITETPAVFFGTEPTPITGNISASDGGGANLRQSPNGKYIATLDNGTLIDVYPETQVVNNVKWLYVFVTQDGQRIEGWVLDSVVAYTASTSSTLGIGSTMTGEDGMTLLYVPEGEFTMGSDTYDDEKPVHTVYLNAYWIDQTEVTNGQYALCVSTGGCTPPSQNSSNTNTSYYGNTQFDDYPVIYVKWNQAQAYCEWAGRRLPTEAEWEKAARGTDGRIYPWGNESPTSGLLNYNLNVGDTTEVGKYPNGVSPYGAYDMAGNVWEWVNDWYGETYYKSSPASNPSGADSGDGRVLRGGSWLNYVVDSRSADRGKYDPTYAIVDFGFRCSSSQ